MRLSLSHTLFHTVLTTAVCTASLAGFLALPALADSRSPVRIGPMRNVPPGIAQCEVRLQIDDDAEVTIDPAGVFIHNLTGQDGHDEGSDCNAPLPGGEPANFQFQVLERRGDIRLVEPPTLRNGGRAIVRIHDGQPGFGRYRFRITWAMGTGLPPGPPPGRREGRVRVVGARWGAPGQERDVTQIVQSHMREGRLEMRATNDDIGFDPSPGRVKTLVIFYEFEGRRDGGGQGGGPGGARREARFNENDFVRLP